MPAEEEVWKNVDPDDIWVMDKLILSRKMYYNCGPVGLEVTKPGYYIAVSYTHLTLPTILRV